MEMTLEHAQTIITKMAKERYTTNDRVIDEYNRYQKDGECQHFWPDENTACQIMTRKV